MTLISITKELKNNQKEFKKYILKLKKAHSDEEKISIIAEGAKFATYTTCARLNCSFFEKELGNVARKNRVPLSSAFEESSVLHVFTACWLSGGHTQVARRWIENSPAEQKHSIVFTNQPNPEGDTPASLRRAVAERAGEMIYLDKKLSPLQRALKLREIASYFEKIILHMHMEDIIPVLAFATEEFQRPIAFFNHADHLFSLGVSISDLTIHFRKFALEMATQYRGTQNNIVLHLPMDRAPENRHEPMAKKQAKENLGIDGDSYVILSLASEYKFAPFDDLDFALFAKDITSATRAFFLLIGPDRKNPYWEEAFQTSRQKIVPLGFVPHDQLEKYLAAADIALDSFPFSSFVSLLDIAKYDIPCCSLVTPLNAMESFEAAGITANSLSDLRSKILANIDGKRNNEKMFEVVNRYHASEFFSHRLKEIYKIFPKKHNIYSFKDDERTFFLPFEAFYLKNQMANAGINCYRNILNKEYLNNSSKSYSLYKLLGQVCVAFIPLKKYWDKARTHLWEKNKNNFPEK